MDKTPGYVFLMAAKYEFMSQCIKTGSFISFNFTKIKCKIEVNEESNKYSTFVKRNQNIGVTVDKPFVCVMCDKGFTKKCNLKTHRRIHTGEKPYKCNKCHTGFAWKSNLKQHQRVHTDEKPYECGICHKRFKRLSGLILHKATHTGDYPHKCDICGKEFIW